MLKKLMPMLRWATIVVVITATIFAMSQRVRAQASSCVTSGGSIIIVGGKAICFGPTGGGTALQTDAGVLIQTDASVQLTTSS